MHARSRWNKSDTSWRRSRRFLRGHNTVLGFMETTSPGAYIALNMAEAHRVNDVLRTAIFDHAPTDKYHTVAESRCQRRVMKRGHLLLGIWDRTAGEI